MDVTYKNVRLMKNSTALELYQAWKKSGKDSDKKLLDSHMDQLEHNKRKLEGTLTK